LSLLGQAVHLNGRESVFTATGETLN